MKAKCELYELVLITTARLFAVTYRLNVKYPANLKFTQGETTKHIKDIANEIYQGDVVIQDFLASDKQDDKIWERTDEGNKHDYIEEVVLYEVYAFLNWEMKVRNPIVQEILK